LEEWASLARLEYDYAADNNLLTKVGSSNLNRELSFTDNRLAWKDNFHLLAHRLTGLKKSALWVDIYALQILFSQHEEPVYFCPVYRSVNGPINNLNTAHPQVPLLVSRLKHFQGVSDNRLATLNPLFTVVPIIALPPTAFGYMAKDPMSLIVVSEDVMCQSLATYTPKDRLEMMGITEF
jgi:hypothetical protein